MLSPLSLSLLLACAYQAGRAPALQVSATSVSAVAADAQLEGLVEAALAASLRRHGALGEGPGLTLVLADLSTRSVAQGAAMQELSVNASAALDGGGRAAEWTERVEYALVSGDPLATEAARSAALSALSERVAEEAVRRVLLTPGEGRR